MFWDWTEKTVSRNNSSVLILSHVAMKRLVFYSWVFLKTLLNILWEWSIMNGLGGGRRPASSTAHPSNREWRDGEQSSGYAPIGDPRRPGPSLRPLIGRSADWMVVWCDVSGKVRVLLIYAPQQLRGSSDTSLRGARYHGKQSRELLCRVDLWLQRGM